MESRSSARGGDRGQLDHHRQVLLLRPAAAWSYASAAGVSWPAQRPPSSSYTCGYCKREFRSAQALGGHMRRHREQMAPRGADDRGVALLPDQDVAGHHAAADQPPVLLELFV